jgi:hypothetical protein
MESSALAHRPFVARDCACFVSLFQLSAHSHLQRTAQMHRDLGQVNVRKLIRQLDEEATAASIQASLDEAKAREWDSDPEDDEKTKLRKRRQRKDRLVERLDKQEQSLIAAGRNRHLWVDKYAPKGYADLLSPEHINREVLEWLKSWDTCVFGSRKGPDSSSAGAGAAARTIDNHMLSNGMLSPAGRRKVGDTGDRQQGVGRMLHLHSHRQHCSSLPLLPAVACVPSVLSRSRSPCSWCPLMARTISDRSTRSSCCADRQDWVSWERGHTARHSAFCLRPSRAHSCLCLPIFD